MAARPMVGLSHLEYRVAAAVGVWYHNRRGSGLLSGLKSAKAFAGGSEVTPDELIDAAGYAFRGWFRAAVAWFVLFAGYGLLFDGLFYTPNSPIALLPIAVFGAGMLGSFVETSTIKTRLTFLVNASNRAAGADYAAPKYAAPKFYDFWIGVVVTVFIFLVFIFGFVVPA